MQTNWIKNQDCITGMAELPPNSVKMVFTDLPYGITDCNWDKRLPLEKLWPLWYRALVPGGVVVLTSIQPFTTMLINSNLKDFKYCWYWIKNGATGFCFCNYQPMRNVEDICVFHKQGSTYHPQGLIKLDKPIKAFNNLSDKNGVYKNSTLTGKAYEKKYTNYPKQTLKFSSDRGLHPTQKPVAMLEYLIQTYTEPGDIVLDCCMGSGTTAIAAMNTGREYIGYELDKHYYDVAMERIEQSKK